MLHHRFHSRAVTFVPWNFRFVEFYGLKSLSALQSAEIGGITLLLGEEILVLCSEAMRVG
jgi:hypothetical protein